MRKVNPFKPTAGAEAQPRQVVTRLPMTLGLGLRSALAPGRLMRIRSHCGRGRPVKLWYRAGDVAPLRGLALDRIACLDVETTELDPHVDEALQIALVRGDDEVLLSRYVRPEHKGKPIWRCDNAATW